MGSGPSASISLNFCRALPATLISISSSGRRLTGSASDTHCNGQGCARKKTATIALESSALFESFLDGADLGVGADVSGTFRLIGCVIACLLSFAFFAQLLLTTRQLVPSEFRFNLLLFLLRPLFRSHFTIVALQRGVT
jgi:hypothetical protein